MAQIGNSIDSLICLAFACVLERRRSLGAGKAPGPESPAEAACCLYICHSVHLHSLSQCCLRHTVCNCSLLAGTEVHSRRCTQLQTYSNMVLAFRSIQYVACTVCPVHQTSSDTLEALFLFKEMHGMFGQR